MEIDTHHFRRHLAIKPEITLPVPIDVQIQLDAIVRRLCDLDVGYDDGHDAELDLCEVQRRQRAGQHRLEHGLDDVADHLGAGDLDVRPQVGDDVVEEACKFWT